MEGDQSRIFREKLSQWVASQGFWFQLRHSLSGGGGWSMTVFHLGRIVIYFLLLAILAAAGGTIYLFKRTGTKSFQSALNGKVTAVLGAKEASLQDFVRSGGVFKIRQFAAEGTSETFFNRLDATLVECQANFLGGITGPWEGGTIRADQLNVNLKAGADSPAEAQAIAQSMVKKYPDFNFTGLDAKNTSMVWGYSAAERVNRGFSTQGRVDNSHLKATRSDTGWHFEFEGGTFSQGWIQKAEIQNLIADWDVDGGLRIAEASFKIDQTATVTLKDIAVSNGDRPKVSGRMKISHLDVHHIIPDAVAEYMEGSVSGDFKISGAINTAEGLVTDGDVRLDRDVICLRERLPLLKAMTVLDNYHSYRKVEFNEGGFHLRTSADKVNITNVDLKAGELMTLKGGVLVRQPTKDELAATPSDSSSVGMGDLGEGSPVLTDSGSKGGEKKKGDITLKDAVKMTGGSKQGFDNGDDDLFDRHAQERLESQGNADAVSRLSRALRYEGKFAFSLPPDAFERADMLREKYPADSESRRIPIEIQVNGQVGEISVALSESLLQEGARK